jgi:hypothetical protein
MVDILVMFKLLRFELLNWFGICHHIAAFEACGSLVTGFTVFFFVKEMVCAD